MIFESPEACANLSVVANWFQVTLTKRHSLKILLTSIGTRGDIEPFLAIGELLTSKGHHVIYSFPQQFKKIIDKDTKFYALSPKIIELIESDEGRTVMGKASLLAKLKAINFLYREGLKVNKELMLQQYEIIEAENPDLIIHNAKCNYPLIWGLKHNKKTVLVSPVPYFIYYVKGHSHIGFNKNCGTFFNKLTYRLSTFGLIKTIYDAQKHLPIKTSLSKSSIRSTLFAKKLVYTISPQLFNRPDYWKKNAQVLGYHERNKIMDWEPSDELIRFLERHPKVLFLTFGSMVNSSPKETSNMLYRVLEDLGIPTIINTAAGGLLQIKEFEPKKNLFFTKQIPYEWILKRVHAVVHHGGSGTTHLALKYGCPTLIIPHIIDQFGWNRLIHEIGAGPKGTSIKKLTPEKFKELLIDLIENEAYKKASNLIGLKMKEEKFDAELYDFIME